MVKVIDRPPSPHAYRVASHGYGALLGLARLNWYSGSYTSEVAPMPSGAAVATNGLKSWVMLFSGELSMTSSLLPSGLPPMPPEAPGSTAAPEVLDELGEPPEEQ